MPRGPFFKKLLLVLSFSLTVASAVFLTILVHFFPVLPADVEISRKIQTEGGAIMLPAMKFVSIFGDPLIGGTAVILLFLLFFLFSYTREMRFILFMLPAEIISFIFKLLMHRPRPTSSLIKVFETVSGPGFPSGHVVHYVVFFGLLMAIVCSMEKAPFLTKTLVFFISSALIVAISVSRVYLGAHWATDAAEGYLLGFIMLSCILSLYFRDAIRTSLNE